MSENKQGLNPLVDGQGKNKLFILQDVIQEIEKGENLSFFEIKKKYNEESLFFISLKYVTTTKKTLCMATGIPVEAACRYKRRFEEMGLLKQSKQDVICPYTKHPARLISTNPKEFPALDNSDQLTIF